MNFIQQAYKGNNNWIYYIVVLVIVFFGWQFIGVIPLFVAAALHTETMSDLFLAASDSFTSIGINSNLYLLLVITTFAFGLLALFIGVKFIHKRSVTTLITSRKKVDWKRFWVAFCTWGFISIVIISAGILLAPENYTWNFKPLPFFSLLGISLLFLPLQTSFEELLFRGYLLQGFGTWFQNRWLPLILTSVIFGLLHAANPEVAKLGYGIMIFYIGTGFLFGILTLMDEGTELALGVHAINNILAAVFVTTDWTVFQTDALFVDTSEPSVGIEIFLTVFVLYPLLLFFFSKKYGWKNWREKLIGNIQKPVAIEES